MISSFFYNIKQAFVQIFRNRGMSAASIFSILAMLLILGLVFIIVVNINLFTEIVKQDYDQVEVFIKEDATDVQIQEVINKIKRQPGVTEVEYRSEEDALRIMKERWGESGYLLDSLGENPLPASIMISVESLDDAGRWRRTPANLTLSRMSSIIRTQSINLQGSLISFRSRE